MGIFDRFKRTTQKAERISIFDTDYPIDRSDWFQVFSACLGKSSTIQDALITQVAKGKNWNVDFAAGKFSLGADSYPVQFIGSESSFSNTWKWGWDNVNGFNDSLLKLANEVKNIGEKWRLEPLITADFELDDIFNGHSLSIVACGILKNNYCYYKGPHAGGAVLMGISDVPNSVFAPVGLHKFVSIAMQCVQQFQVDHEIFIESFLLWNGTKYERIGKKIIAQFDQELHIEFEVKDEITRICSMKSK